MANSLLIVGTGALACLFAARLGAAGQPVAMLGTWPAGLAALRAHGVRLTDSGGVEKRYPVQVAVGAADCPPAQIALVLVKSWQTDRAAAQLANCLPSGGFALTLQNGLNNREILAEKLGPGRVGLGVTTTGATLLGPGHVRPGGPGVISLEQRPWLPPLVKTLRAAGFTVELTESAEALIWRKLVINAAINPLTALLRVPNGELLARPAARQLMAALAGEAAAVAAARGISIPHPVGAAEYVAERTAANHSSMYQDIQRGAPTEIDAICGAIVRAGEAAGVPTPVNQTIWQLVKAAVSRINK